MQYTSDKKYFLTYFPYLNALCPTLLRPVTTKKFNNFFYILQDYAFDFHGSISMEIFTGCCDYPDGHILLESWHQHRQPLLHLINEAGREFTGVVQDQEMQKPMENATVTIIGSSRHISVDSNGRFHVYLPPGHHDVVFHCHGYQDFRKV